MVVFSTVVANYLKAFVFIVADGGGSFFRTAFCASLRRHHVALVKSFLLLLRKKKGLLALHTRNFYVRHRISSICVGSVKGEWMKCITQEVLHCK